MLASNYPYASAKLRALEPHILDATDIERMVDAPDFNTAFKVLNDTDYADNLLEVEPINYRDALREDYVQLYQLLNQIIPDKILFKLLYLHRDFLNIKLLFKAKYFEKMDEIKDSLTTDTVYNTDWLRELILNQKNLGLDNEIKKIIIDADKAFSEKFSPDFIDSYLTKAYFDWQKKLAKKSNNQYIINLIEIQIDNANVISFLRAKRLKLSKDRLADLLIEGGRLSIKTLISNFEEDLAAIKPTISSYYDKVVIEKFDICCEKDYLFEFEKALQDYITRYLQKAKRIAYGPEVVVAYFWAKQIAVQNVRIIMTGKLNQIEGEEIKKTLRQVY